MATDKYPEHKALNPFFDIVVKGLNGLVDGEHYYDAISEDAQFEFLYRFPGWPEHEELLRKGEIWDELSCIVEDKNIDLIVVGTHCFPLVSTCSAPD